MFYRMAASSPSLADRVVLSTPNQFSTAGNDMESIGMVRWDLPAPPKTADVKVAAPTRIEKACDVMRASGGSAASVLEYGAALDEREYETAKELNAQSGCPLPEWYLRDRYERRIADRIRHQKEQMDLVRLMYDKPKDDPPHDSKDTKSDELGEYWLRLQQGARGSEPRLCGGMSAAELAQFKAIEEILGRVIEKDNMRIKAEEDAVSSCAVQMLEESNAEFDLAMHRQNMKEHAAYAKRKKEGGVEKSQVESHEMNDGFAWSAVEYEEAERRSKEVDLQYTRMCGDPPDRNLNALDDLPPLEPDAPDDLPPLEDAPSEL